MSGSKSQINTAADKKISCLFYKPLTGSKRCRNYREDGSCNRQQVSPCIEWLIANGRIDQLPKQRDLFGDPIATPKISKAAKPMAALLNLPLQAADPLVVRSITQEQIASFKALGTEIRLSSADLGEVWMVAEYTDQDRTEISAEHAALIAALCSAFPDARVTAIEKA